MEFICCKGKMRTLFFLPTICKIERRRACYCISMAS
nr:MAG TPA: hypothetical protein [Caudoviricetes sp.]